jgi:hypothetical protein
MHEFSGVFIIEIRAMLVRRSVTCSALMSSNMPCSPFMENTSTEERSLENTGGKDRRRYQERGSVTKFC